jgi:tRNA A58 N-methylase Trm61
MNRRTRVAPVVAAVIAIGFLAAPASAQNQFAADAARLVKALKLSAGQTVADIGAGAGELSVELARIVGPSGRVYATELNTRLLPVIRRAAEAAALTNVSVIEGHATRTNLPDGCCDALVVRFVYHHFEDPGQMNASLRQALKPGAFLAVIDFSPDSAESADPAGRARGAQHGVTPGTVVRELLDAGLELVSVDEGTKRTGYLAVMRRPVATSDSSRRASAKGPRLTVRFENDRVRVVELRIPPGERESLHTHPQYLLYALSNYRVRNFTADGKSRIFERKAGDVYWGEPITHGGENLGTTEVHALIVEIKNGARR